MEKKFRGLVIDQLNTLETRKTAFYGTEKEAHDAAEKLCKKTMGNRGTLDVEEILIFTITETLNNRNPESMILKFKLLPDGYRMFCKSSDFGKMTKRFMGPDGFLYVDSELFDNYDFEINDGKQVIFSAKIR